MNKDIKKFFLLGLLMEILCLAFLFVQPLRTLTGDTSINLINGLPLYATVGILLLMTFLYWLILKWELFQKIPVKLIILLAVLFNFTLLFILPVTSNDVFTYIYRSRVLSVYHQNPYLVTYDNFPRDAFFSVARNYWSNATVVYGPLFTLVGAAITSTVKNNLSFNLFAFKFLAAVASVSSGLLLYKITKSRKAAFLYLWNPLILFEFAVNAHNDSLMIVLLIISLLLLFKAEKASTYVLSWIFLILSVFIKYFSAILIPFYLIYMLRNLKKDVNRGGLAAMLVFYGLGITIALFLPFWRGLSTFQRIFQVLGFQGRTPSIGILLLSFIPWLPFQFASIAGKIIFMLAYIFVLIKSFISTQFNKRAFVFCLAISFALFLALFFNWFFPWYLTTLIALMCISFSDSNKDKRYLYILATTIYGVVMYLFFP